MISGLDHIAIGAASVDATREAYALLLGRQPERLDTGAVLFRLGSVRLALQALDGASEGLSSLAFAVDDLSKTERLLANGRCRRARRTACCRSSARPRMESPSRFAPK